MLPGIMSAEEDLVDYEEEEEEPTRVKGSTAVKKGRGHRDSKGGDRDRGGVFENLHTGDTTAGPAPSVEGWVIFVSGLHQEAQVCVLVEPRIRHSGSWFGGLTEAVERCPPVRLSPF